MRPVETTSSYVRMQEGDLSDKHPCARHGFNSYRLPDDLNSSKVIGKTIGWFETTLSQRRPAFKVGRCCLAQRPPLSNIHRLGTYVGMERGIVREDSLHKDTKNFSIGNGY